MKDKRYMTIARRIDAILSHHASGMGQGEIAALLNTSQPSVSRVRKGEMLPPETMLDRMDELWGIDLRNEVKVARDAGSRVAFRGTRLPQKSFETGVPYYDVDFMGGLVDTEEDLTVNPEFLINFRQYDKATCWCNVSGHSMEPEINSGDIIALQRVEDFSFLPYGDVYAIVMRNGMRTVKRLAAGSDGDTYTLVPTNKSPEYSPQEIRREDILRVYKVLGCMKRL